MLPSTLSSCRHPLQVQTNENPVNSHRSYTWRKHPDNLHEHIADAKLRDFFVRLQRYRVGQRESFTRGMELIARELGFRSKRTLQRRFDALGKLGLAHRIERRIAYDKNQHNVFTVITIDELFLGVRLSSTGRKFVTHKTEIKKLKKASTPRARRAVQKSCGRYRGENAPSSGGSQASVLPQGSPAGAGVARLSAAHEKYSKTARFTAWREMIARSRHQRPSATVGMYTGETEVPMSEADMEAARQRIAKAEAETKAQRARMYGANMEA